MARHVFSGSGAPSSAPTAIGQHYIDTSSGVSYISVGTTSSSDWETSDASAAIAAHVAASDPHTQYVERANNLSDLASASTARSNLGLGDVATENVLPIAKGGTGQTNSTAALNNLLPSQTGNSGKYLSTDGSNPAWSTVDSLPSQTGNSGKFLTTNGSAASWDDVPSIPVGTFNNVTGFDGAGAIYSIDGWQISSLSGMQFAQNWQPDAPDTGQTLHNLTLNVDPVDDAPDAQMNVLFLQADIDPNDTGFNFGTNGNAVRIANLYGNLRGTGDVGELNFINQSFDIGNGTDPISVRGFSYAYGFGNVAANVTINGAIQGYGFQPSINAAAVLDTSAYVTAFYDYANIDCEIQAYTSYGAGPQIDSVANNTNYNGFNANPSIDDFNGNSGANLFSASGQFGTINSGSVQCFSANPTVTLNKGTVFGVNVTMDNVTNYAGVQASIVVQDITYEFNTAGSFNNTYQIEYLDDTTAGSETVTIAGLLISVHMESGVSTATQIAAAATGNPTFAGAVTTTITGTGSNTQVAAGAANFTGGIDAGRKVAGNFDGDVSIDGSLSFTGGLSIGSLSAFGTLAMTSGTGNPVSIHTLITSPTVAANATLTNADLLGVNTAMLLNVGANATVTTGFLGLQALGLPAVVSMGSGSTIDHVGGATFAISLDPGAAGGTIAEGDLCSALAIPNGATTVTALRGYFFDLPFGSVGTTHWGLYSKPATALNYMAGSLVVGTSDTPTNASVGIEVVATDKAILLPRMNSTQEAALTAVNGMVIYNSQTNKFRGYENGAWVDLV